MYHASAKVCSGKARQMYVGDVGTRVRMEVVESARWLAISVGMEAAAVIRWADRCVASSGELMGE